MYNQVKNSLLLADEKTPTKLGSKTVDVSVL